jgi:hypothetical protein
VRLIFRDSFTSWPKRPPRKTGREFHQSHPPERRSEPQGEAPKAKAGSRTERRKMPVLREADMERLSGTRRQRRSLAAKALRIRAPTGASAPAWTQPGFRLLGDLATNAGRESHEVSASRGPEQECGANSFAMRT